MFAAAALALAASLASPAAATCFPCGAGGAVDETIAGCADTAQVLEDDDQCPTDADDEAVAAWTDGDCKCSACRICPEGQFIRGDFKEFTEGEYGCFPGDEFHGPGADGGDTGACILTWWPEMFFDPAKFQSATCACTEAPCYQQLVDEFDWDLQVTGVTVPGAPEPRPAACGYVFMDAFEQVTASLDEDEGSSEPSVPSQTEMCSSALVKMMVDFPDCKPTTERLFSAGLPAASARSARGALAAAAAVAVAAIAMFAAAAARGRSAAPSARLLVGPGAGAEDSADDVDGAEVAPPAA